MNQAQTKALRERLDKAERQHRWGFRDLPKPTEPAEVVKARKTIKAFEEAQQRKDSARETKIRTAYRDAEEALLFRESNDALAAVKKFEAMKFTD